MLTIYIVRHAKSSWAELGVEDHDRKLNERGIGDLVRMGEEVKRRNWIPEIIYSSTAARAMATAQGIGENISISKSDIIFDSSLYLCTAKTIQDFLSGIDKDVTSVMLVGHNPGLTDFYNEYTDIKIDNVPTCAIGAFQSEENDWKSINQSEWKSIGFIYPKM